MTGWRVFACFGLWLAWAAVEGGGTALAMTPSADVVEVATGRADTALAPCAGLRVRRGSLEIGGEMAKWLARRSGKTPWRAPRRLRRLEDVRLALLLRSPDRCEVLLSDRTTGRIPFRWHGRLPFHAWRIGAEGIRFFGRVETSVASRERKVLPVPFTDAPPLRLYHHGRLEIYRGLRTPRERRVGPDDAARIHLEGPGDEARFAFHAAVPGSLIVERTPGNMPNLDMRIGADGREPQPRGMADLKAGEKALIVFRYSGAAPLDFDAGFLFTPDTPLACEMTVVPEGRGKYRAAVVIRNVSDAPVFILRPSTGTVEWHADGGIIAAARPAAPPDRVMLAPGGVARHEAVLSAVMGRLPTGAVVRVGAMLGELTCGRVDGSRTGQ